jgi:hypothetical protein
LAKPAKHIAEAWKVANLPNPEIVEIVETILLTEGFRKSIKPRYSCIPKTPSIISTISTISGLGRFYFGQAG